jgi:hypothetical protein
MLRAITLFTAAATVFVCRYAGACLWETKAELDARYGKPISTFDNAYGKNYIYRFKQFQVLVTLLGGKSQSEVYQHSNNNKSAQARIDSATPRRASRDEGTIRSVSERDGTSLLLRVLYHGSNYDRALRHTNANHGLGLNGI